MNLQATLRMYFENSVYTLVSQVLLFEPTGLNSGTRSELIFRNVNTLDGLGLKTSGKKWKFGTDLQHKIKRKNNVEVLL